MEGFDVYRKYVGIKLHFNSDKYDFVKLKGAVNATHKSYEKRGDKYFFRKLADTLQSKDIVPFFVAQFIECNSSWIGSMLDDINGSLAIYRKWKGARESITENVNVDIRLIQDFLNERGMKTKELFTISNGITHPIILRFYLEQMITIETMIYLDNKYKFIDFFQEELFDPISEHHLLIIEKYKSFLNADVEVEHVLYDGNI